MDSSDMLSQDEHAGSSGQFAVQGKPGGNLGGPGAHSVSHSVRGAHSTEQGENWQVADNFALTFE